MAATAITYSHWLGAPDFYALSSNPALGVCHDESPPGIQFGFRMLLKSRARRHRHLALAWHRANTAISASSTLVFARPTLSQSDQLVWFWNPAGLEQSSFPPRLPRYRRKNQSFNKSPPSAPRLQSHWAGRRRGIADGRHAQCLFPSGLHPILGRDLFLRRPSATAPRAAHLRLLAKPLCRRPHRRWPPLTPTTSPCKSSASSRQLPHSARTFSSGQSVTSSRVSAPFPDWSEYPHNREAHLLPLSAASSPVALAQAQSDINPSLRAAPAVSRHNGHKYS